MLDHLAALAADSARLAGVAEAHPLDRPVPSCPGWALRDLVAHVGRVQRFWAAQVAAGDPSGPLAPGPAAAPPADEQLVAWLRAATADLLGALGAAGPGGPCWTWWGEPLTAGAVARHQVQEAAVHRWDAELAAGDPTPLDADVAHDGVAEFLEVHHELADAEPVRLVAADTGGRWRAGAASRDDDADGARAAVRAPASDLVLLLHGRIPTSAVDVAGDVAAVEALIAGARTA